MVAGHGLARGIPGLDGTRRRRPRSLVAGSGIIAGALVVGHQLEAPGPQVHVLARQLRLVGLVDAIVVAVLEQHAFDGGGLALQQGRVVIGAIAAGTQVVASTHSRFPDRRCRGQRRQSTGHRRGGTAGGAPGSGLLLGQGLV